MNRKPLGECFLKALPIAEKGSETRYRIFSAGTNLTLKSAGDECHVAVWESDQEPIAVLNGFFQEMRDLRKVQSLANVELPDVNAWLGAYA